MTTMTTAVVPHRYVRIPLFCMVTGYTPDAVDAKIRKGKWIEGRHYRRAPDGHILVDLKGYEAWVENQHQAG
jgi:hypothetical protein